MSWQSYSYRVKRLAVFVMLGSASTVLPQASAMTIGQTIVSSHQNEPLIASIAVSDVDSATFSVKLAEALIYQKMGLSPTASMTAQFLPTSNNSGNIIIQTQKPLALPFADVVLNLNQDGQQKLMPKTLLVLLQDQVALNQSTILATNDSAVLERPLQAEPMATPLIVRNEMPPPLFDTAPAEKPITPSQSKHQNRQELTAKNNKNIEKNSSALDSQAKPLLVLSADLMPDLLPTPNRQPTSKTLQVNVRQKIKPQALENNGEVLVKNSPIENPQLQNAPIIASADITNAKENNVETVAAKKAATTQPEKFLKDNADNTSIPYVVKRADTLWQLSKPIADRYQLNITEVMARIHAQNPEAFVKQNPNRLKLAAKLDMFEDNLSQKVDPKTLTLQQNIYYQRAITPAELAATVAQNELTAKNN